MLGEGSFLALLSTHFMTRLLDERPNASQVSRRGAWLGYVLSTAAGIYSLYYFFFLLIFHNLYAGFQLLAPRARSLPSPEPSRRPPFLSWLSAQDALFLF